MDSKIRVAVLRGGPSPEYDVSLKTGAHVISLLSNHEKYEPLDIFISKTGEWHRHGLVVSPAKALRGADVAFNAMHGFYGEDGQVQRELENLSVPFTGSGSVASALAMDKEMAKRAFALHNLNVARHEIIRGEPRDEQLVHIFRTYLMPVIVKPANGGSSLGTKLAHTVGELKDAIKHALGFGNKVLVEEYIRGKEATCGVVENARGEKLYALLPVEIRKPSNARFFDYESKYSGNTEELCPGYFTNQERRGVEEAARAAHHALGLRHYSRSDFIITKSGKIYILETNSLPGFTQESLLPKSLHAVGWQPKHFVDHIIAQALAR